MKLAAPSLFVLETGLLCGDLYSVLSLIAVEVEAEDGGKIGRLEETAAADAEGGNAGGLAADLGGAVHRVTAGTLLTVLFLYTLFGINI